MMKSRARHGLNYLHNYMQLLPIFYCILALWQPRLAFAASREPLCETAHEAGEAALQIRGLAFTSPVACEVRSREQVRDYLKNSIVAKIPAGRLKAEEFVYGVIGMIPEDYAYEQGVINLYLQQIGAYYDTDRSHFVMADWISPQIQRGLAVHELTHALQDQHFNIDSFIDMHIESSDVLLSRTALVEGDATLVSLLWTERNGAPPNYVPEETEKEFPAKTDTSVPRSLSRIALFPYIAGLRYARALYAKGGFERINEAFRHPPQSTEEVLHVNDNTMPELRVVDFSDAEMMVPGLGPEFYIAYRDTLGEFGVNALLSMSENKREVVEKAAAGWGGDKLVLIQTQAGPQRFVVWKTHWDSMLDKQEFLVLYVKALKSRFPSFPKILDQRKWHSLRPGLKFKLQEGDQETSFIFQLG